MDAVIGLVTHLDVDDLAADHRQMSVSARHEAVLSGGTRVLLLGDRGWSSSGSPDVWQTTSPAEIADTGRMVVGPDEPFDGHSHDDMEADHWASLAAVLQPHGVEVDPLELGRLPHDVVLSERLLARIGIRPDPDGLSSR